MAAILGVAVLYVCVYAALLLPPVQNWIKDVACSELTRITGGKVEIERISIAPFNELTLYGLDVHDPQGKPVFKADRVGAGIKIWELLTTGRPVITFAEIVGMDAHITQARPGAPLNIQYLIDAFKSKEKKKPARFDLEINNIVLRKVDVSFDKLWLPRRRDGRIDFNHIQIKDLAADLRLPVLKNDDFSVDLRRLSLRETSGIDVTKISGEFHVSNREIAVKGLGIELGSTHIFPGDITLPIHGFAHLKEQILDKPLTLSLHGATIVPADFAAFLPVLAGYEQTVWLNSDLTLANGDLIVDNLQINSQPGINVMLKGRIDGITGPVSEIHAALPKFSITARRGAIAKLVGDFATLKPEVAALIGRLGDVEVNASLAGSRSAASFKGKVSVAPGSARIDAAYKLTRRDAHSLKAKVQTDGFDLGELLTNADFGPLKADVDLDASLVGKDIKSVNGTVSADVPLFTYKGYPYTAFSADLTKRGKAVSGEVAMADPNLDFDIVADVDLAGGLATSADVQADIRALNLSALHLAVPGSDISLRGQITANLMGDNLKNVDGTFHVNDLHFADAKHKDISLGYLTMEANRRIEPHSVSIDCDYFSLDVDGDIDPLALVPAGRQLAHELLPTLVPEPRKEASMGGNDFNFRLLVKKDSGIQEFVKLPVSLLEDLELTGRFDAAQGVAQLDMEVPYLRQGKDKLLRDTRLHLGVADGDARLSLSTLMPNNKGDVFLALKADVSDGRANADLSWLMDRKKAYKGLISLSATFPENEEGKGKDVRLTVNPSQFEVADTVWHIDRGDILYADRRLNVEGVRVHRPGQYALIQGTATASPEDTLFIRLQDIDLDYVFETLAIPNVVFGGKASGVLTASALFSKEPVLKTDALHVVPLMYNHCALGDATIASHWDNAQKAVYLDADIREERHRAARVYGSIFVTRDSLSLRFDADRVRVGFMQPFMAAFSSDVSGRASGKLHLYGTFKDINLEGWAYADPLNLKIDITNTVYTAIDTVKIDPGIIHLDGITIRDREGHTALLNGEVRHNFFHDPEFDFTLTHARDFLCYDTNAAINPTWYGTIYGNGSASMHGVPGFIDIKVDMTTAPRSSFVFCLDENEQAEAYQFITFTDKRKEAAMLEEQERLRREDTRPAFLREFERRQQAQQQGPPTRYAMDIRASVEPSADLTIVMDPVAGDRIRCNGSGSLRMSYNSEGEMGLYGTYTLDRGNYNFTLQDVIVRDFKIASGSKITFTGDPLAATLDITAAYRVNTNLTDLDESFATDRELNRTTVPVDALLKVQGPMQSPEISFDVDLPTVSEDVSRKVRSIISTSDMMNRQMIYLLALNRFYTPDYMNTSRANNELASAASATISSQLSNMLGQLTPSWSFMPNFRTEKGDFSDMEVDLALSSTLLNNRLLFNGNLGYRDKATSSTSFIGDFDIEYLLNRAGTWRLKAYNHFNDQNYYLRSALTTQGLGIVFKKDFNRFLPGLFRRKKKK